MIRSFLGQKRTSTKDDQDMAISALLQKGAPNNKVYGSNGIGMKRTIDLCAARP